MMTTAADRGLRWALRRDWLLGGESFNARAEGDGLAKPSPLDFQHLLAFRVSLRRFQHWSEKQARAVGLTHVEHQLLVAIKGHPGDLPPAVGDIAAYLLLRHHSAVELIDRAEAAGLVRRSPDPAGARIVRVRLTAQGDQLVTELTRPISPSCVSSRPC
jgi:DNA-binding MarR family transcriptional regulator